ncbi:MBL fold metallo-hydrolase [Eubacteriaceae bacterium ES3]|nr:MBL fold metallo-hydrolase [Eubacteriaceae bacterium ES3]
MMKLTVLGNTGPFPGPGGACSGYLLTINDYRIILDFGNGTLANLQKYISVDKIDMIILSHLHPDHFSDLYVLRYALQNKGLKLPIYAPSEPPLEAASLYYKNIFQIKHLSETLMIEIDDITIRFKEMKHPVLDYAIKIQTPEKSFVYTGDTAYTESLIDFSKGADALLIDSAFLKDTESLIHCCVKQACELGNKAEVNKLILTHFDPYSDPWDYQKKGETLFNGPLKTAEIGKTILI